MTWSGCGGRRAAARDAAVLLGAAAVTIGGSHGAAHEQVPPAHPLDAPAFVLLVLLTATVALRRRSPLGALAAASLLLAAFTAAGYPHGPSFVPLVIASMAVGLRHGRRTAWRAASAAGLVIAAGWTVAAVRGYTPTGWATPFEAAGLILLCGVPALVGTLVRSNRVTAAQAEEEATRRRIEQERLRLAREVHDVVGHSLSVISLRAAVALHVLDRRPEQAQLALEAIRRASVDALDELRSTLALTRTDPPEPASTTPLGEPAAPPPPAPPAPPLTGLRRLPSLLREVRMCGIPIELIIDGDQERLAELPADVDLAAFRIVQESLTNVLRHARRGDTRVRAELTITPDRLTVRIVDSPDPIASLAPVPEPVTPEPATPDGPVTGRGLAGLRERATELGGTLTAGPAGGGWQVRADLPVPADDPRQSERPRQSDRPAPADPSGPAAARR
ncbi:sensor histidine kinase [Frankia sp. AgB32]|uniref:sensor histidine kinase n=1 Tax=Frankia sp. AgB32 TaxID=631119 RepID=UPI00200D3A7B|nr:histidine kinase [Frankia sp. AgB32]MCK9896646.1 histidine kinase [Frankia sp. AgB32]